METLGVLFINSSRTFGGTERWTILAAKELHRRGHRVVIGYRFPIIRAYAENAGLSTVHLPLLNDADIISVARIRKILRKNNLDVVVPTRVKEYWLGTLGAKSIGRKSIIRLGIVRIINGKWKNRQLFGKWADGILVNACAIVRALQSTSFIPEGKIHLLYNGVEVPLSLAPFETSPDPFIFIYVGSLIPRKNVDLLVQVFQTLVQNNPDRRLYLWVVGDGPERSRLEQKVVDLNLEDQIKFWGHRMAVAELLQKAHTMVLLSSSEGFPNVALEAMAWGTPLVLNCLAGVEEIASHKRNALLVDLKNKKGIVQALQSLLDDGALRRRLRLEAYQMVRESFSSEAMGKQLEQLLWRVVNE